jgi:anti-sigma B factor antagonist
MSATHAHPDHHFSLHVEPERDVVRVCPSGEVDLATVDAIERRIDELRSVGFARVALDLREVTFLDSTGIRLVLELSAGARADGWEFAVIEGPDDVRRVFELTGVKPLVPFIGATELRHARWGGTCR